MVLSALELITDSSLGPISKHSLSYGRRERYNYMGDPLFD